MRVFLSHSSKDKGFVEAVAEQLRPGTYELDSLTFDNGLLNSQAIIAALRRCDLFCLFLSSNTITSSYVDLEILLGVEFIASGKISRFLVICMDDDAFASASSNVRMFNIVRKQPSIESAARLIQGTLISASKLGEQIAHPFIGREDEMLELEKQVADHSRPLPKGIFVSGNHGAGRRTLARKFYQNQYPHVGTVMPTLNIPAFSGIFELYRIILGKLRPAIVSHEFRTRIEAFEIADVQEKRRLTADLLNSLLSVNEAAILLDEGGILTDAGSLTEEMGHLIGLLNARPHPPVVLVAPRMIPLKLRRTTNDLSYISLRALSNDATSRLISRLLKDNSVSLNNDDLMELVRLSNGHPFNIYRMVDEISERGLAPFLASPRDFIDWKHRQSSEYLLKLELNTVETKVLALLKMIPELDFESIVNSTELEPNQVSDALLSLNNNHVLDSQGDHFFISPALQVAVERDHRTQVKRQEEVAIMKKVANSLSIRIEEGSAPISLVDAAILSSLEAGQSIVGFAAAFLLPSHYVWMTKRHYDARDWDRSLQLAREALKGKDRLSLEGTVAACRYLCLSAARSRNIVAFDEGIIALNRLAKNDWVRSNIEFLHGFDARLKGNLPLSEKHFRESYQLSPGNRSTARELAAVCLARGNLDDAENFAREAHSQARTNPFLIDILIAVLIRKYRRDARNTAEINDMFTLLERVGEEGGRSFYTARKAEFEHLWGDNKEALKLIEITIAKTPTIFEPRRIHAEILIKNGNNGKALDAINVLRDMVSLKNGNEAKSHYRSYLETYSKYLLAVRKPADAKRVFDDQTVFTVQERDAAVRIIEIEESYRNTTS